jgi:hypothetical protein
MKKVITGFAVVVSILAFIITGCTPPQSSAQNAIASSAADIPDGSYIVLIGAQPGKMISSPLFQRFANEEFPEEWGKLEEEMVKRLGIKPVEIGTFAMSMAMPSLFAQTAPEAIGIYEGTFDEEMVLAAIQESSDEISFTEADYKENSFWLHSSESTPDSQAIKFETDKAIFGQEETIQAYFDMKAGEGKKLLDRPEVRNALNLIDADAQVAVVLWSVNKSFGPFIAMAKGVAQEQEQKDTIALIEELETVAGTLRMDTGFHSEGVLVFATEEAASSFEEFYNEALAKAPAEFANMEMEEGSAQTSFTEADFKELLKGVEVKRNGKTLKIGFSLAGDSPLWAKIIEDMKKSSNQFLETPDVPGNTPGMGLDDERPDQSETEATTQ